MRKKQEYSRSRQVWHHGKFIGVITTEFDADENILFNRRIARIQRSYNMPEMDVLYVAIMKGLAIIEYELDNEGKLTHPEIGDPEYQDWLRLELLEEIYKRKCRFADLDSLYDAYGNERFIEIATERGLEISDYLEHKKRLSVHKSQAQLDREFLAEQLANTIIPISAEELKQEALEQHIISIDENGKLVGWERLDKTAERYGYKCKNPRGHYCSLNYNSVTSDYIN